MLEALQELKYFNEARVFAEVAGINSGPITIREVSHLGPRAPSRHKFDVV